MNDTTATISVLVSGQTRAATNNGDGTWTLANDAINPALADGTYAVTVTATDTAGNAGVDGTTNELRVDTVAPTIAVNALVTAYSTPALTGTVNDNAAVITVVVSGQTLTATNNGNTVSGDTVGSGEVAIGSGAFSGYDGIGNFVINTGHNNNLQSSMNVTIVLAPPVPGS